MQMIQVSFSSSFIVLGGGEFRHNPMFPAEKTKARPDFEVDLLVFTQDDMVYFLLLGLKIRTAISPERGKLQAPAQS